MANEQYEVLDWDVELDEGDDSSGFKLLEEGFYPFKVVGAKKTYTNGKPSYPCVDLSLKVGESETLKIIVNAFPDWFGPDLAAYQDDEGALPFDEHYLKALLAPRVYFDSQALSDMWAGPVNTWMTAEAAREAEQQNKE